MDANRDPSKGKGEDHGIRAEVSSDAMSVELILPPLLIGDALSDAACRAALREAKVELDESGRAAIVAMIESPPPPGLSERRVTVQRGSPARDGTDGRVEWLVKTAADVAATEARIDFYEQHAFAQVQSGQALARVHPPTRAQPGRDVLGRVLRGRDGRPARLTTDNSMQLESDGRLVARIGGAFRHDDRSATVQPLIEIRSAVDFSTGNINFKGDVHVRQGVRDRFKVCATGRIEVSGQIESAVIVSGGDLVARGGMAGHERGSVEVGGSLIARYLNNVHGVVRGWLCVDREIVDCRLEVGGEVDSSRCAMFGGELLLRGSAHLAIVGGASGTRTVLCWPTPGRAILLADRLIRDGVLLRFGHRTYALNKDLRGPVRVFEDSSGHVLYVRNGCSAMPLAGVSRVVQSAV